MKDSRMLQGPFLRVIESCSNQNKANRIVEKLKAQGHPELFTWHDVKKGRFDIGTFDYSKIDIFNQLNAQSMDRIPCHVCGKPTIENDFFKCINCGQFECKECGMNRLYNGLIPTIHTCGHDDFEFLANVGPCSKCKQPLGFRAVPQVIRMHMMSEVLVAGAAMVRGIVGCYAAEELFIEKEIIKIYNSGRVLHDTLLNSLGDKTRWFQAFFALKSNYNRLAWSSSYIKDVLHVYLTMFGLNPNPNIKSHMGNVYPLFVIFKDLMTVIANRMRGELSNEKFSSVMPQLYNQLRTGNVLSPRMDQALQKISELGHILDRRDHFDTYAPFLANFFQLDVMDRIMRSYPGTLKC